MAQKIRELEHVHNENGMGRKFMVTDNGIQRVLQWISTKQHS